MRKSLDSEGSLLYQILRYSMGWSDIDGNRTVSAEGKTLRPMLCLFACDATGGVTRKALPAAVSLEFIHNFSLIHDDIQDRDEIRHHRPTVWSLCGEPKAIVAGNALRMIADTSLWRLVDEGVSFDDALRAASLLTEAYLEMIEGQYLDLLYEGRSDISTQNYLDMISKKTGALIRCALNLGALIGTRDSATVKAIRECGRLLGFVFQIRDDMLGIWGNEETTGKPVGADIRRRKNTLPVVYARSRAYGVDKNVLSDIYQRKTISDKDLTIVLDIMDRLKVFEYAENLATEYHESALESVSNIELSPKVLQDIEEISHFLLARQH